MPLFLALLLACSPASILMDEGPDGRPGDGGGTSDDSGATDGGGGHGDTGDEDGGDDGGGTDHEDVDVGIFQLDRVLEIALTLDAAGVSALADDPYTYVEGDVTIDGVAFPQVGVRIKGRLGSYRAMPSKSGFKLDFLEYDQDLRPDGLEKLNLNNQVQDCAKVKELASYAIHELVGTPSPRVAYAHVTVNGDDYGLYSVVEAYDDEFLDDRFDDPSGNLYDGDYFLYSGSSYWLVDFTPSAQDLFELDEGEDVGLADIYAVTEARMSSDDFQASVGAVVDLEQHARFWAANAWTAQYDSYSYYQNNYRVYFDPVRDGRAVFLPWDPDWAFYASTPLHSPTGVITQGCYADSACRDWTRAALDEISAGFPGSSLEDEVWATAELILPYVASDPKREHTMGEVMGCQADLRDWFVNRAAQLDAIGL